MADAQVKRAINNILNMTVEQSSRDFRARMKALVNVYVTAGKFETSTPLKDAMQMMSVNARNVVLSAVVDLAKEKERQRAFSQANMEPAKVRLWVLIYALYHDIELKESAKALRKANKRKNNKPVVEKWEPFVVALCAAIGNKDELQKVKNKQKISEFLDSYRFADGSELPNVDRLEGILSLIATDNMTADGLATFLKERKESDAKKKREAQQLVQAAKAAKA